MIVSRATGALLGLLVHLELIGEVQDKSDKALRVRLLPQAGCRGDAAAVVDGAGEGHEGEVHALLPESPHPPCASWSEHSQVRPSILGTASLLDGYFLAGSFELLRELIAPSERSVKPVDLLIGEFGRELLDVVAFPSVRQISPRQQERARRKRPVAPADGYGFADLLPLRPLLRPHSSEGYLGEAV